MAALKEAEALYTADLEAPISHHDKHGATTPLVAADWTAEEERKAKWKLDLTVMPLLMIGFYALQLDRGNISNAITDGMLKDIGITQNQFNVGQQLLSAGIVLLELPSNILLYKVGPSKWLSMQVVAFGLVSTFQAFQHGYGPYLATRLLLGLCESGYIPGSVYTLTTWYTRKETATRVTIFFLGNLSAAASTNLVSYGILKHCSGAAGKPGWFWIFVIMGILSVAIGFVLALFLPNSVNKPHSFFLPKLCFFTPRELHILKSRVLLDDPTKSVKNTRIGWKAIKRTLAYWVVWPHFMITFLNNAILSDFGSYAPTIIKSFGFPTLKSNALASVGPWILIPVSLAFSYVSDRFNYRAGTTVVATFINLVFMVLNARLTYSNSKNTRFAGIVLTQLIDFVPHTLNVSWCSLNARDSEERAIAAAMMIIAANASGIYGAQIFRSDDSPRYHRGFAVNCGLLGGCFAFAVFLAVMSWRARRRGHDLAGRSLHPANVSEADTASDLDSKSQSHGPESLER